MLTARTLLDRDGIQVHDVVCTCGRGPASAPEEAKGQVLVLVRRGVFRRTADGAERLFGPGSAYVTRAGEEQRFAHPADGGDICTAIAVAGLDLPPAVAVEVGPELDLRHRLMVAALRRGEEADEHAVGIAAAVRERLVPERLTATGRRRRALADDAREALAADPSLSLPALGRAVGAAPHHLSRVFHEHTGTTVTEHRRRLRVRAALERLADGDSDLARLAADVGFADHAHLTRSVRAYAARPPSVLRPLLAAA